MAAIEAVKKTKKTAGKDRAAGTRQEIEFSFSAPEAKNVCLAGQFNEWNMTSMPMKKGADGTWKLKMKLAPGNYEYKFVVDGTWSQDDVCGDKAQNSFGTYNCVRKVA